MPQEICLVAQFRATPGQGGALERVLRACVAPTRAEPGCRSYTLHRDQDSPEHFAFYEVWADEAALEQHMRTPHLLQLMQDAKPLLAERFSLLRLRKLE